MNSEDVFNNWPLDGWSIGKHTFKKLTEVLPKGSTVLEFGSGAGTGLLSNFYSMKSIEADTEYINKYKSTYFHVPIKNVTPGTYPDFPEDPYWFDAYALAKQISAIGHYDCIIVDGPKGYRGGLYYNHRLFDFKNKVAIFDDVHAGDHRKLMEMIAKDVGRNYIIYNDDFGKQFGMLV